MPDPDRQAPLVVVCANQAWNLVNFRAGLITRLLQEGFRVEALAPPDPAMEARLRELGCGFTPLEIDSAGLLPHRDLATFLAIRSALGWLKPAAWLSWTIKPNVYGSLAAGLAGIPAFPNVSGLGTAFIRRNLLTLVAQQLYRTGFRRAPTVFFQNRDDRAEFVSGGLVRDAQARILPGSGIDPEKWQAKSADRPGRRRFLMLSRVVADKGVREFVEAARLVRRDWPDARFILMGEVAPPNRTAIPAEEVAAWVADGIIELREPVADVRPDIAEADFIVLPSYREGLSRVLLEAAAMGRPIVTTDVTGCRDVVTENENGFLCAPMDAASLAGALGKACAVSDADWQKLAKNSRARVVADFTEERVAELYLQAMRDAGVSFPTKTVTDD